MNKTKTTKILVIGLVLMFIGVSYSSAIEIKQIDDKQKENDCNCKEKTITNTVKLDILFNKIDLFIKKLKFFSKNNPELKQISKELSLKIKELKNTKDTRPICNILGAIYSVLENLNFNLMIIHEVIYEISKIIAFIVEIIRIPLYSIFFMTWFIGYKIDCWDFPNTQP